MAITKVLHVCHIINGILDRLKQSEKVTRTWQTIRNVIFEINVRKRRKEVCHYPDSSEMSIELFHPAASKEEREINEDEFSTIDKDAEARRRILPSAKVADRLTHEHFRWRRDAASVSPMHPLVGIIHDKLYDFPLPFPPQWGRSDGPRRRRGERGKA